SLHDQRRGAAQRGGGETTTRPGRRAGARRRRASVVVCRSSVRAAAGARARAAADLLDVLLRGVLDVLGRAAGGLLDVLGRALRRVLRTRGRRARVVADVAEPGADRRAAGRVAAVVVVAGTLVVVGAGHRTHHLVLESHDPALGLLDAALDDAGRAGLLGQQVDVAGQVLAGLIDLRPQPRGLFSHWASSFR